MHPSPSTDRLSSAVKLFHIPFITSSADWTLHAIVQRSPTPISSAASDHPEIQVYGDVYDMFADAAIDLVIVATTPESHFALTQSALQHGKHVLVDKPFVPSSREADILIACAKEVKRLLCVFQNRRWDTDFLTVRQLIADGTLGRVVEYETHFDNYATSPVRTWHGRLGMSEGGGVLYDLGVHMIDQAYVLFGMPHSVTALLQNARQDGSGIPDSMTVLLGYGQDGTLVTIKASPLSIETEQLRFLVHGTRGSYRKTWLDVQEEQLQAGRAPTDDGFAHEDESRHAHLTILQNGQPVCQRIPGLKPQTYGQLYKELATALASSDEEAVPVKAVEARNVLRILEAVVKSSESKMTVGLV